MSRDHYNTLDTPDDWYSIIFPMPEGVDARPPVPAPKEVLKPSVVELRRIEATSPEDVQRYTDIDQALDPAKWATAKLPADKLRQEIEESAVSIPFERKVKEPDFYLFGVSEKSQPGQSGKLLGFVSTYGDENVDKIRGTSAQVATVLGGREVAEVAFARHSQATEEHMVDGVKLGVAEVIREHVERTKKGAETLAVTSYVQDDPEDARVLETNGFVKQGAFDLREEGAADPDMWDMYVLAS